VSLRESCIREMCTCSLSGGRRLARKRASSDPTSMNQSNNEEERFSAESGERRARAKENIVQSNTDPTQSGTTESDYAAHEGQRQTKYPSANAGSRLKRWMQWEGPD